MYIEWLFVKILFGLIQHWKLEGAELYVALLEQWEVEIMWKWMQGV